MRELEKNKWSISVGEVDVTVMMLDGQLTWSISGSSNEMFDVDSGNLSDLTVAGRTLSWTRVIKVTEEAEENCSTMTIVVEDSEAVLRLTRYITVYAKHPVVRTWGKLENIGSEQMIVDSCNIFNLSPHWKTHCCMFHVEQFSWKYRRDFFSQNELWITQGKTPHEIRMGSFPSHHWEPTSCAWFALQKGKWGDALANEAGIFCGIEFNGKSRIRAWASPEQIHIVSSIDELTHRISPSGVFEIAPFFIGHFRGDWDEAGYATQRFAEAHIHPPMPDNNYPWVQYNSWAYEQNIHEEQQLAVIDRCAELGIELVVLDLGWARTIGDWRPDPVKFPRGLKPLVERAKSYGIRLGVHVALAQCNLSAPIMKEHPEWLTHTEEDYFGAAPLCLGHEPCRNWLIAQLVKLVEEEGISYIIQDGEDMVKLCDRHDHTHAYGDSNYSGSQYGLDIVIQSLRRECPQLVLENCEDGGCMMTYKMASMYHTSITVDNIDTYSTRQGVYGASYAFSPRYSVRYMQDAPTRYTLYSSIFGGPLIFMHRILDWDETQMLETRRAIEQYKKLRVITRDAKIFHIAAPICNGVQGGWGWDAIQAVSPDKQQSVLMVYRARGDANEKTFKPRGLLQNRSYSVSLTDKGTTWEYTGEELENDGITIDLDEFSAEIIHIHAV